VFYVCLHVTLSVYPIVPCDNTCTANNLVPQAKRAMGIALMVALGSIGWIIGSFIFQIERGTSISKWMGNVVAFVVSRAVWATVSEVT
jgi:hypothetical protein